MSYFKFLCFDSIKTSKFTQARNAFKKTPKGKLRGNKSDISKR